MASTTPTPNGSSSGPPADQTMISAIQTDKQQALINGLTLWPDKRTGLLFTPQDGPRIGIYFVPALGVAPAWCSFLDALTEELEQTSTALSNPTGVADDDVKFVSHEEMEQLGGISSIGETNKIRPYMHGYFVERALYHKLASATAPYEASKKAIEAAEERVRKERGMRIPVRKQEQVVGGKINKNYQEHLRRLTESAKTDKKSLERKRVAESLLAGGRFDQIFNDPDFEIAEEKLPNDDEE